MNCKIVTKSATEYVDSYCIDPEALADFLGQYKDECCAFFVEGQDSEILDIWNIDVEDAKIFIKNIKRDYDEQEVVFDDTTAKEVVEFLEALIASNKKNSENLEHPETLIIEWL